MIRTSTMGVDDLGLTDWVIIDLSSLDKPESFDRHMFGYCEETGVFQLCSKILEETDEYCQTRSRKYFKGGPAATDLDVVAVANLVDFLFYGWRIELDQVREVLKQVTTITVNDEMDLVIPNLVTEDGIVIPTGTIGDEPEDNQPVSQFAKTVQDLNDAWMTNYKAKTHEAW